MSDAREIIRLNAERQRLETLLAHALLIATRGTGCTPEGLLELLCEISGTDPARAAVPRRRLRRDELVELLRPTPEREAERAA